MTTCEVMARLMGVRDGIDYLDCQVEARHTMKSIGMTDRDIDSDFPLASYEEIMECMIMTPDKFEKDCETAMHQLFSRN